MSERLQKYLARAGVASRRHAELLITGGQVKVNNVIIRELGTQVTEGVDLVMVDGELITPAAARTYWLLYKPPSVVTTLDDPQGRATVRDFLPDSQARLFPVGRLDFDAEGALLLTDDGALAHALMHPKFQVPRTYLAKVKGSPDEATLEKLRGGVRLEDGVATPKSVEIFEHAEKNTWLKLVVTEGRPHLIKRLCAAVGHPVLRLFRPSYGGLSLGGLQPGEVRTLSREDVEQLKATAEGKVSAEPAMRLPARRHGRSDGSDSRDHDEERHEPVESPREVAHVQRFETPRAESRPERAPATRRSGPKRTDSSRLSDRGHGAHGPKAEDDRGGFKPRGPKPMGESRFGGRDRPERGSKFGDDRGGFKPRGPKPMGESRFGGRDRPERGSKFGDDRGGFKPRGPKPMGESRFGGRDRPERGSKVGDDRGGFKPRGPKPMGESRFGGRDRAERGSKFGDDRGGFKPRGPKPMGESRFGGRDRAERGSKFGDDRGGFKPRGPKPMGESRFGGRDRAERGSKFGDDRGGFKPRGPKPMGESRFGGRDRPERGSKFGDDRGGSKPRGPKPMGESRFGGRDRPERGSKFGDDRGGFKPRGPKPMGESRFGGRDRPERGSKFGGARSGFKFGGGRPSGERNVSDRSSFRPPGRRPGGRFGKPPRPPR